MAKPGRNDLCRCGSGRKYKKCCEAKERRSATGNRMLWIAVGGAVIAALLVGLASFTGDSSSSRTVRIWSAEHGHYHDASGVAVP